MKNKKTKADTSDYYTEVFSKGKRLDKISNDEESTLSDKFDQLPSWIAGSVFAIVITILHFTTEIGVGYYFFALMGAGILAWIISVLLVLFGKNNF
tara:strand:+ start:317 stop:604 length:288 start_codon:yes stop_codon:yes gene_type:complete